MLSEETLRNRVLQICAATFVLLVFDSASAQPAPPPLPQPTSYVSDYAGVVDKTTKDRLETTLGNLDRQQHIQFSVVTIETTGGKEIFAYSLAVAQGWDIGSKNTKKGSLLLLVAIKDRKYFTQVSRQLEGDLPDELVGQIQREQLVPAFRVGQYGKGLVDTIDAYIALIAEKNRFSTATIIPADATRQLETPTVAEKSSWRLTVFGLLFLAVVGGGYFVYRFRWQMRTSLRGKRSNRRYGNSENYVHATPSASDRAELFSEKSDNGRKVHSRPPGAKWEVGSSTNGRTTLQQQPIPRTATSEPIFDAAADWSKSRSGAVYCHDCGTLVENSARFCETCGFDLSILGQKFENQPAVSDISSTPATSGRPSMEERLSRLGELKVQGLINEEEYRVRRQRILDEI